MKILIVEDDFTSRLLLSEILKIYGTVDQAVDGQEAITAVQESHKKGEPYNLICMDILMPNTDGHTALLEIRALEETNMIASSARAKVIMTTALGDPHNVITSFYNLCDAYLVKPVDKQKLLIELKKLGFIS